MLFANVRTSWRRTAGSDRLFYAVNTLLLVIALLLVLYPLVYVVSASFSSPSRLIAGQVWLLPKDVTLQSYRAVFRDEKLWLGYRNTILYTLIGVSINISMTMAGAYPLSRRDLKGGKVLMLLITFTMFFRGGLIPTYLIVRGLGLTNTIWALSLPIAITVTNLIIARTYIQTSIPFELQESGFMDGASNLRLFFSVVLPLSKPILAVLAVFYGVMHWNAYFHALIYLTNSDLYPLQLILRNILLQNQMTDMSDASMAMTDQVLLYEGLKYAVVVVSSLPVMALYPFMQRYFVKGVMIGALKG